MSSFDAAQDRDANRQVISGNDSFLLRSEWTFVTGTTGATGAHTLFTVTGNVLVAVFGICSTNLAGQATFEVGTADSTAGLIAQIADAEDLDARKGYIDGSPSFVESFSTRQSRMVPVAGKDVILTIGSTAVTAGVVDFYCIWRPLSIGANITVTTPA